MKLQAGEGKKHSAFYRDQQPNRKYIQGTKKKQGWVRMNWIHLLSECCEDASRLQINLFTHNEIINATDTSNPPPPKFHIQIGYLGIHLLVADKVNQGDLFSSPSSLPCQSSPFLSDCSKWILLPSCKKFKLHLCLIRYWITWVVVLRTSRPKV